MSAPNCLTIAAAHDLAVEPVRDAAPHRRRLAHVGDVAERHGRRPCTATTVLRRSSTFARARRRARSTPSAPCVTKPPAAFTLAPSTACMTSSSVTPRAAMRSGSSCTWNCAQVAAEPLDRGDARHREQPVLDLELREIAQRHQIGGCRARPRA